MNFLAGLTNSSCAATSKISREPASFVRFINPKIEDAAFESAWAEDPPSRTRRLVTNVLVEETDKPQEYSVRSYLLVTRSRFNFDEYDLISAERRDILRADGEGFKLAKREILLDQAVLGTPNLAIFL